MEGSRRRFIQGTVGAAVAAALATPFKLAYAGTPSGDLVLDFTALGNADPYVNSNFTAIDGLPVKISGGALTPSSALGDPWGLRRFRFNGAMVPGSTVRAKVEVGTAADSDLLCPAILAADGSGYLLNINQVYMSLMMVDASGNEAGLISGVAASAAPGDIFTLEWVPQTHTLTAYLNGTPIPNVSIVDTTYSSGLAFAFAFDAGNHNSSTMLGFAGEGSQAAIPSGFLPAGHWVSAKMPLNIVHPRPDTETGPFTGPVYARHRLAYYDGVNPVQYECPIRVQGGARPHVYQVVAGPSWLQIGASYGSQMYGILYGTPTGAIAKTAPETVTVRVFGQDQDSTDVTFTLATSSSTTDFVFVDSVNGSDTTGSGTYSQPFATLAKVMGTNVTQTTFPAARVYMSGNLQWPTQTGAGGPPPGNGLGYFDVIQTKVPVVYMALPGHSVSIDATLVQLTDWNGSFNDLYIAGSGTSRLAIVGSSTTVPETHTFELYNASRCTWWNVDFQNPVNRVAANGNSNSTSIFASNSGDIKHYYTILGCTEFGRSPLSVNNSMLLVSLFSVQDIVFEDNTASGDSGFGFFFKDTNRNVTAAYNKINLPGGGPAFLFGCQTNNHDMGGYPGLCEACYNIIANGALFFDFQGFEGVLQHWSYRNTIYNGDGSYNYGLGNWGPAGTGPYYSDSDVVIAKSPGGATTVSAVPFTVTNNEVWVAWSGSPPPSNCPINPATGLLQDVSGGTAWRSTYLGTRGWEIA